MWLASLGMKNPNESNGTISDCYFVFFGVKSPNFRKYNWIHWKYFREGLLFVFLLKNSSLRQRGSLELEQEERCMCFFRLSTLERYLEAFT